MNTTIVKFPPALPPKRTTHPFLKAFACAGLVFACLLVFLGAPKSSYGAGQIIGALMIPAVITGIGEWRSAVVWPLWRVAGSYVRRSALCCSCFWQNRPDRRDIPGMLRTSGASGPAMP